MFAVSLFTTAQPWSQSQYLPAWELEPRQTHTIIQPLETNHIICKKWMERDQELCELNQSQRDEYGVFCRCQQRAGESEYHSLSQREKILSFATTEINFR